MSEYMKTYQDQKRISKLARDPFAVSLVGSPVYLFINPFTGVILMDGGMAMDPDKGPEFSVKPLVDLYSLVLTYGEMTFFVGASENRTLLLNWAQDANGFLANFKDHGKTEIGTQIRRRAVVLLKGLVRSGISVGFTADDIGFILGTVVHDAIAEEGNE